MKDDQFLMLAGNYITQLINYDEVERALLVLNNLPAKFRCDVPPMMKALKTDILSSICTPMTYIDDERDCNFSIEGSKAALRGLARGFLIEEEVKRLNAKDKIPHIVDMGPGDYFLPVGLKHFGYKFSYEPLGINESIKKIVKDELEPILKKWSAGLSPRIFVANEVIEHIPNVYDLATNCHAFCGYAEYIHLSTPNCTYDDSEKDWLKKGGLPHLRAYTPNEFLDVASEIFPDYKWEYYGGKIMSLRGIREDITGTTRLDVIDGVDHGMANAQKW